MVLMKIDVIYLIHLFACCIVPSLVLKTFYFQLFLINTKIPVNVETGLPITSSANINAVAYEPL